MVQRRRYIEQRREAFSAAQKEKAVFTRDAIRHILKYSDQDIPSIDIEHPSKVLRLWLERFPDLAADSLGKHATRVSLSVEEPGADPLTVNFNRLQNNTP